ncbi:MAG TPA: hypothetical protein VEV81_10140, partial [Pyrinomonadaceae bacterium]|nr:hypothetical protein [Pyrinomonadaceae bacterium]
MMSLSSASISRIVSRFLVFALISWIVGAGYRPCCETASAAPSNQSAKAHLHDSEGGMGSAVPTSAGQDHCRRAQNTESPDSSAMNPSCATHSRVARAMPCCSLAAQAFTDARKLRIVPERSGQTPGDAPTIHSFVSPRARLFDKRQVVSYRGEAYLLGCVFLI